MGNVSFLDLINFVFMAGVLYGLIFSLLVFTIKRRLGFTILLLNLQVLFITLNNLQAWLIDNGIVSDWVYIKYMRVPWYFLCMPLFYVFMVNYLKIRQRSFYILESTLGIFGLFVLVRLGLIFTGLQRDYNDAELKLFMDRYSSYEEIFCYLHTLSIYVLSLRTFYVRRSLFKTILQYDDLLWIKHFLNLAGLIIAVWCIAILMSFKHGVFSSPEIYYPLRLSTTVLIYWIGIKGLIRFSIREDRIELRKCLKEEVEAEQQKGSMGLKPSKVNPQGSNAKGAKQEQNFQEIDAHIRREKVFLNPYLSLDELAGQIDLSPGYLSSLINTYSASNFSDYINGFRVNQAKEFIQNEAFSNYTIVSIGLESGFNSKATFYKAFKKLAGMTPTEYKASLSKGA